MKRNGNAIGILEINYYANTVFVVDQALKAAQVELVSCHKTLGGRMCHTVLAGETSAVYAAMEAARDSGRIVGEGNIKVCVSINNPHQEVWKLLNMIDRHEEELKTETGKNNKNEDKTGGEGNGGDIS
nr:BMC domain-containing protein [uncultured Clostridium sp.]